MDNQKRNQDLLKKVQQFLSKITYKPGATFEAVKCDHDNGGPGDHLHMIISLNVPDIKTGERVDIASMATFDYSELAKKQAKGTLGSFLARTVRDAVRAGEKHEADEWLKYDGRALFDPHKRVSPLKRIADVIRMKSPELAATFEREGLFH